jgi:hypothetical protein
LREANDRISNAIACLPIFRHYDIGLRELIEKRVVDRFAVAWVFECPSDPSRFQLEMPIFSRRDAPIDFGDARLKLFFKVFQVCLDRLLENIQSRQ